MKRRDLLLASCALALPFGARGQQPGRVYRIGIFQIGSEERLKLAMQALMDGMRERGYVVGRNLAVEIRYVETRAEFETYADELVALKPDVLLANEVTGVALKKRTSSVPIVLITSADPVNARLVQNLARPGTNVTGIANLLHPLAQKQIELVLEILPKMKRIAMLGAPFDPAPDSVYYGRPEGWEVAMRNVAQAKKLELSVHRAANPEDLRSAFAAVEAKRAECLLVTVEDRLLRVPGLGDEIRRLRIPVISGFDGLTRGGALLSYGVDFLESYRYATKFVDLILKGGNPADIPVEQPRKFQLVLNLKTAKTLGLKMPQSLLLRADRVFE